MNRRTVLTMLGTATVATAGCLSQPGDRSDGGNETNPDDTQTDNSGETGTNGTATDDETPGSKPYDPTTDIECQSFVNADRTVCWPTADTDAETIYLDASTVIFEPSTGDGSVETMEFVLHNNSEQSFGLNPHAWAIKRQTTDGWEHVAPEEYIEPLYTVESGQTYTWRLSVEEHTQAMAERTMAVTQDLDDGTYAFQITGQAGGETSERSRVECIALFEVNRK